LRVIIKVIDLNIYFKYLHLRIIMDSDEPEEIEFDFDKYKDMYQKNAAEMIESNIDDDDDFEDS